MKNSLLKLSTFFSIAAVAVACGPTPEELRQQEMARQDSLKKVQEQAVAAAAPEAPAQTESRPAAATPTTTPTAPASSAVNEAKEKERLFVKYDTAGTLTLQVEAWRNKRSAEKSVDAWKKRGLDNAYAVAQENPETGEVWYRVRIGKFRSRKWAVKQAELLKEQYKVTTWIDNATNENRIY